MDVFKECAACAALPGSPLLCDSCSHNREVIDKLLTAGNYLAAEAENDWNKGRVSIDTKTAIEAWKALEKLNG